MKLSDPKWNLTASEKVLRAEIIQALHVAQYNVITSVNPSANIEFGWVLR